MTRNPLRLPVLNWSFYVVFLFTISCYSKFLPFLQVSKKKMRLKLLVLLYCINLVQNVNCLNDDVEKLDTSLMTYLLQNESFMNYLKQLPLLEEQNSKNGYPESQENSTPTKDWSIYENFLSRYGESKKEFDKRQHWSHRFTPGGK